MLGNSEAPGLVAAAPHLYGKQAVAKGETLFDLGEEPVALQNITQKAVMPNKIK